MSKPRITESMLEGADWSRKHERNQRGLEDLAKEREMSQTKHTPGPWKTPKQKDGTNENKKSKTQRR